MCNPINLIIAGYIIFDIIVLRNLSLYSKVFRPNIRNFDIYRPIRLVDIYGLCSVVINSTNPVSVVYSVLSYVVVAWRTPKEIFFVLKLRPGFVDRPPKKRRPSQNLCTEKMLTRETAVRGL